MDDMVETFGIVAVRDKIANSTLLLFF